MATDQVFSADARATVPAIALLAEATIVASLLNQPLWTDERIREVVNETLIKYASEQEISAMIRQMIAMRDDYEASIAALKAHADDLALQLELAELDGPL